ncbi:MAG: hypothetical protein D6781_05630 [Verrucomicrobia bacterium]|nr:MAG: hypothetical protein D6781_05630 [Verrucomicrobiota bacterium]
MSKRRHLPPATDQSTPDDHLAPVLEFLRRHDIDHGPVTPESCPWRGAIRSVSLGLQLIHFTATTAEITATATALALTVRLPLRAPAGLRPRILECLQALNLTGHHLQFLLDPSDGTILCRQLIDCSETAMTAERFNTCFCRQLVAIDGMALALFAILGGGVRPESAPELAHAAAVAFFTDARLSPPPGADPSRN